MTATVLSTELAEAAAKDVILARCGYSFGIGKHVGAWLRATADHIVSADAEIAELRRLLGDAREVIEDARIWLAIDPRGREQDLFVIAHLLERIDAAQGVDLCGDHHASTVSACCCVMYPAATR